MLSQLADHYRIINPSPSDAVITQRSESIVEFLKALSEPSIRYSCVEVAMTGFRTTISDDQLAMANLLTECIKGKQPSFASAVAANAMELRVCAAIALSEYISSSDEAAIDVAALAIAAAGVRPLPEDRPLAALVEQILRSATTRLDTSGAARRKRRPLPIPNITGGDAPTVAKSAEIAVKELKDAVTSHLMADQEELQILWWVFGGHSVTLAKPFKVLDAGKRAVLAGFELATRVIVPPTSNARQFLLAITAPDAQLSVQQIAQAATTDVIQPLKLQLKDCAKLITSNPATMPLAWLFFRRLDSGMAGGWESEFEQKTQMSSQLKLGVSAWSEQIFNECVAGKIVSEAMTEQ
jgi:hypothetical protein